MRAALIVNEVTADADANLSSILDWIGRAAESKADLALLPEAAVTGLINDDVSDHDLPLGREIPGPTTDALSATVRECGIYVGMGLLERDGSRLYDSAILLTPQGDIILKYRRIQPQWHARNADPSVYCQGAELRKVETPLGSFAFLICGDLFDDAIVERVRDLHPDWLLFPFARSFSDFSCDQKRWDEEERAQYVERVKLAGVTALMVNCLEPPGPNGGAFGGAMVVSSDGVVSSTLPLGRPGMLLTDLADSEGKLKVGE
jgi:predicted amidohydrolase